MPRPAARQRRPAGYTVNAGGLPVMAGINPSKQAIGGVRMGLNHSHSMVPGGFEVTS